MGGQQHDAPRGDEQEDGVMVKPWSPAEDELLRSRYADEPTGPLANELGRSPSSVYQHARKLGLEKSASYLAGPDAQRFDGKKGAACRFTKGQEPWNAGKKGWQAGGRAKETQFAKGSKPQTWKPVGTEKVNKDGLLVRKVSDTGHRRTDWQPVHVIVWREYGNQVPAGSVVVFRDGNARNFAIENLECVTRAELMRRNSIVRFPAELRSAMTQLRKLNKAIEARHEKQD